MPKIVLIETRAGWMATPTTDLPLTRAYHFRPGVPVDVPDADFDLLVDCTLVEGRSFVPADADYAKPHIAAARAEAPKGSAVVDSDGGSGGIVGDGEFVMAMAAAALKDVKPADPPRDKKGG